MALREIAITVSAGRAALGVALLVVPGRVGGGWIGDDGTRPGPEVLARSVGVRDVALGVGGVATLASGSSSASGWLLAQAVCDIGDLIGTLLARGALPANGVRGTVALAGGSAAIALAAAASAD